MMGIFRGRWWLWEISALAWLLLLPYIMTAHGHLDFSGHALGRDFVNYWTAGQLAREGQAATVFHPDAFLAAEHRLFDPRLPFHFWSYPPPALLLVSPLGWLGYVPGLIAWSAAGLAALAWAARRLAPEPRDWLFLVLSPAAAVNVALGQNGAITAAILMAGLSLWRRRPIAAGLVLGLLVFKPQIALLLPVAVLAERRWSTMLAAGVSAAGICLLSTAMFGLEAWRGFFGPTLEMQRLMLAQGSGPFQWMMTSAFMTGRLWGLPAIVAVTLQAPVSLWAVTVAWRSWRSRAAFEDKAAILILATFVASPQAFNYDLVAASLAVLWLWRADTQATRLSALLLWWLPVWLITAQFVHLAVAPVVLGVALWVAWRHSTAAEGAATGAAAPRPETLQLTPIRAAKASTAAETGSNT